MGVLRPVYILRFVQAVAAQLKHAYAQAVIVLSSCWLLFSERISS
jgi:hypothetical protein